MKWPIQHHITQTISPERCRQENPNSPLNPQQRVITKYENQEKNCGEECCNPSSPGPAPLLTLDLSRFVSKISLFHF